MSTIKYFLKGQGKCQFSQELIDGIKMINPYALMTREDQLKERNDEIIAELSIFTKTYGQIPVPEKYVGVRGKISLSSQISEIKKILEGKYQIQKLYTRPY